MTADEDRRKGPGERDELDASFTKETSNYTAQVTKEFSE